MEPGQIPNTPKCKNNRLKQFIIGAKAPETVTMKALQIFFLKKIF